MAKTIEHGADSGGKPKSIIAALVTSVIVVLASGGAGYAFSKFYLSPQFMTVPTESAAKPAEESKEGDANDHSENMGEDARYFNVSDLEPITTNIGEPDNVWVRAELALLYQGDLTEEVTETIHQELFAYLKTTKLHTIKGASGLQHLTEDFDAIARARSDGGVHRVLIRGLIFE